MEAFFSCAAFPPNQAFAMLLSTSIHGDHEQCHQLLPLRLHGILEADAQLTQAASTYSASLLPKQQCPQKSYRMHLIDWTLRL
jgi:hypothetical protein